MRVAAPGLDARGLFAELRARVMAEVDYRQEAAAQTAFADAFRDDPDFLVPGVVAGTGPGTRLGVGRRDTRWPRSLAAASRARTRPGGPAAGPLPAVQPTPGRTTAR